MNKTEAINNARAAVGHPIKHGTSWQVFGPYYSDRLNGPSTSIDTDTYARAKAVRTRWVARIALIQMGWSDMDAEIAIHDVTGSIEDLVDHALKNQEV